MHCPSTRGCRRDRACEVTWGRGTVGGGDDGRRRGGVMTVVGIGMVPGVTADEVLAAVDAVLPAARLDVRPGVRLAAHHTRADEPGLVEAAARRGWRVDAY